ncbi:hypothetical protein DAEQUDRAFT_434117 [Daedalea quercina L-15889]|uniref:Secreted protein n=1 Tax=Daedalea quercina L-15889 TaxID=1314783 RepID=A0A165NH79_9APHY|nr:hypothetical protein DAEQUDRAFT_434117 [Daedalea quercina L-15889]
MWMLFLLSLLVAPAPAYNDISSLLFADLSYDSAYTGLSRATVSLRCQDILAAFWPRSIAQSPNTRVRRGRPHTG